MMGMEVIEPFIQGTKHQFLFAPTHQAHAMLSLDIEYRQLEEGCQSSVGMSPSVDGIEIGLVTG